MATSLVRMNGYDAHSHKALAAHSKPTPQAATEPQIRPRQTLTPISEALSATDLEKLMLLLRDLEGDDDVLMHEAPLTTRRRNDLPDSSFALPDDRAYPIDTPERARAALARVVANGTPEEIRQVRAAVRRRYPDMDVQS